MAPSNTEGRAAVIATHPDHASAEDAVRRLQKNGIPMQDLSIVGKDFQAGERPLGFITTGTVAGEGAKVGAWTGGLFGLLVGAAFGGLAGALVGLGASGDKAIRYESEVKAGKFLVTLRADVAHAERIKNLFNSANAESTEVVPAKAA